MDNEINNVWIEKQVREFPQKKGQRSRDMIDFIE